MTQTVFDVGDPITSRMTLGTTHDGTTVVTVTVYRPDGQIVSPGAMSGWLANEERTVQWYATNDGAAGSPTDAADGDWVALWVVTGTGAGVASKIYHVRAAYSPSERRPTWAPYLSDVADHCPRLTIDATTPGSAVEYGTFNGNTQPTDEQAHRMLDAALAPVLAQYGAITGDGPQQQARYAVALRAAAAITRAWPRDPALDRAAADALDRRADAELARLERALNAAGGASVAAPVPGWAFPTPVTWGDKNL